MITIVFILAISSISLGVALYVNDFGWALPDNPRHPEKKEAPQQTVDPTVEPAVAAMGEAIINHNPFTMLVTFQADAAWLRPGNPQRGKIKMSTFTILMRRADRARRATSDPVHHAWWTGYMRGLRRAHHEDFGTQPEHELYLAASGSIIFERAALGHGYAAGLKLRWATPGEPDDSLAHCAKCDTLVVPNLADGDAICPYCNLVL
jgi:hypothetical protein